MYFLFTTVGLARGVRLTPAGIFHALVLLGAAIGAYVITQQFNGFDAYPLLPVFALLLVWNLSSLSPSFQTALGIAMVVASMVLLFVVLPPQTQAYSIQGLSMSAWNLFRACAVSIPCLCILGQILTLNASRQNLMLFGLPLVVYGGYTFFALRSLIG